MSSILDEPAVRHAAFRVSVDFYQQLGQLGLLDQDVELLDGVIVRKMPKSPLHSFLIGRLADLLSSVLGRLLFLRLEQPLATSTSAPEPDLAVVQGRREDFFSTHPPTAELVIEVAISSADLDRHKVAIYAAANVREYWLIEPEAGRVTVFRRPADGLYHETLVFDGEATVTSSAVPGFAVRLPELYHPPVR